jgi:dihydroxy-acid dehydratase
MLVVELCRRWYEQDDASVLPRSIASFAAFENAIALDIAMGGSTNTVLHLLAAAQEGGVDFTMADIDRMSRKVPCLCQGGAGDAEVPHGGRASRRRHHGHPRRAGPRRPDQRDCPTVHSRPWARRWTAGTSSATTSEAVHEFYRAAPGGVPTQTAFSPEPPLSDARLDRANGCIRDKAHAFFQDGGLAVLYGNIAEKGCIVKTAGVDDSILKFTGRARVCESQEEAVEKILADQIKPATSWSSATKARRAAPACRKCSIRPPT